MVGASLVSSANRQATVDLDLDGQFLNNFDIPERRKKSEYISLSNSQKDR